MEVYPPFAELEVLEVEVLLLQEVVEEEVMDGTDVVVVEGDLLIN
jgi:hypothetical protein